MASPRSMVLSRSPSLPLPLPSSPSPLLLLRPLRLLLLTLPKKSPSRPKTDKHCPMTTPYVCYACHLVTTTHMFPAHHSGLSTAVSCILSSCTRHVYSVRTHRRCQHIISDPPLHSVHRAYIASSRILHSLRLSRLPVSLSVLCFILVILSYPLLSSLLCYNPKFAASSQAILRFVYCCKTTRLHNIHSFVHFFIQSLLLSRLRYIRDNLCRGGTPDVWYYTTFNSSIQLQVYGTMPSAACNTLHIGLISHLSLHLPSLEIFHLHATAGSNRADPVDSRLAVLMQGADRLIGSIRAHNEDHADAIVERPRHFERRDAAVVHEEAEDRRKHPR